MAVGIPEPQSSIGRPLLVEVKYGNLNRQRLEAAVAPAAVDDGRPVASSRF